MFFKLKNNFSPQTKTQNKKKSSNKFVKVVDVFFFLSPVCLPCLAAGLLTGQGKREEEEEMAIPPGDKTPRWMGVSNGGDNTNKTQKPETQRRKKKKTLLKITI